MACKPGTYCGWCSSLQWNVFHIFLTALFTLRVRASNYLAWHKNIRMTCSMFDTADLAALFSKTTEVCRCRERSTGLNVKTSWEVFASYLTFPAAFCKRSHGGSRAWYSGVAMLILWTPNRLFRLPGGSSQSVSQMMSETFKNIECSSIGESLVVRSKRPSKRIQYHHYHHAGLSKVCRVLLDLSQPPILAFPED